MILGIQPRSGNMEEEDMDDESMPIEGRTGVNFTDILYEQLIRTKIF